MRRLLMWSLRAIAFAGLTHPAHANLYAEPIETNSGVSHAAPDRLNPTGRMMTIVVPLKERDAFLGDVEVQIGADDEIRVAAAQVLELLSRSLDPAVAEALRASAGPGIFTPLDQFASVGISLSFDSRSLELTVDIPVSARAHRSIGLAELDRAIYGDFIEPRGFSAYLNARGALDYVHTTGPSQGFGDGLVLLNGAMRMSGVVLESEGAYRTDESGLTRDGTRLVHDDIRNLNRWTLGDLVPQGRGFQEIRDMAGVSIVRSYSVLDPQRNVLPRHGRSFTLDRDATVEAFVNGRLVRTIRLQPGTYDLSDFPFVQGSNDVDLIVTDDTGRRDVVSFSLFMDRTQLASGLSEYGVFVGTESSRLQSRIEYSSDPITTGFYRYGLNDELTVGANFQYAQDAWLVGGEAVWGSPWGTLGADVAVSEQDGVGSGWAFNASFERLTPAENGGASLLATFETRSSDFGFGSGTASNPYAYNASLSYNRSLGAFSFAGFQLQYAAGRDHFEDERSVRVTYGRRLTSRTSVLMGAEWNEGGHLEGANFRISLVRRIGSRSSARAEYSSADERVRASYHSSGGRGVGAWSTSASVDATSDNQSLNGSAVYFANRAELGVAHSTAYSAFGDEISDQRTSLRAAASIATAGGRIAVGRPINGSFVIVAPYDGADGTDIEVEPSSEGYYARSGALGPALYGQLGDYLPRTIAYDVEEGAGAFDVGQGSMRVFPRYRSGYSITVGSDYNVTLIGRLLGRDGGPLTLLAGQAIEIGGEEREVELFTNRQGTFGASGFKPGRWRIEMPGEPPLVYEFEVPEADTGIARMGDLRPVR